MRHDGDGHALERLADGADQHALEGVLARGVAYVAVPLDEAEGLLAREEYVVKQLLCDLPLAQDAEIGGGLLGLPREEELGPDEGDVLVDLEALAQGAAGARLLALERLAHEGLLVRAGDDHDVFLVLGF